VHRIWDVRLTNIENPNRHSLRICRNVVAEVPGTKNLEGVDEFGTDYL
jgi:hypothetical protein